MDTRLLAQAAAVLSRCGRLVAVPGGLALPLYRGIPVQAVFPVTPAGLQQTITKEISGDTTFELRAISATSSATTALMTQIQAPSGRFLLSNLADVVTLAGYGSWRFSLSNGIECPPGSKITVTLLDTNSALVQPVEFLFEGFDRYILKGNAPRASDLVSESPRYLLSENQNIMAPCWMAGQGPETPEGCEDEAFVYSSDLLTMDAGGALLNGTLVVSVDRDRDFLIRRLMFEQAVDQGVSGIFLGRMRDSSGYAFMDDYCDLLGLLNGAPVPGRDWRIEAGGQVFIDVQLVNPVGRGNAYFRVHLEGARRRKLT